MYMEKEIKYGLLWNVYYWGKEAWSFRTWVLVEYIIVLLLSLVNGKIKSVIYASYFMSY